MRQDFRKSTECRSTSKSLHWCEYQNKSDSYGEILKMIRVLIFKNNLLDIEASEVEYKLKEFWFNSDDEYGGSNNNNNNMISWLFIYW